MVENQNGMSFTRYRVFPPYCVVPRGEYYTLVNTSIALHPPCRLNNYKRIEPNIVIIKIKLLIPTHTRAHTHDPRISRLVITVYRKGTHSTTSRYYGSMYVYYYSALYEITHSGDCIRVPRYVPVHAAVNELRLAVEQ